jgi:signal transduction histidine kinase
VYVPIYSRGVDVDGWISTVMDVTENERIEQERSEIQLKVQALPSERVLRRRAPDVARGVRALSMGEVAPSIAHEVNQPLAAVLTNAAAGLQWLSGETPNVQEAKESLALIVRDGNRASAIIRSIRELLKKERGAMASLDMNEIIQEAVVPARAEFLKRRIALRIDCSEALPPVWGDRIQLQQVILNLTMNGGEAMASNHGSKELLVTCRRSADDSVLIAVRDCGTGVHPEYVERIFDPFFTTKDAGMGMGLSISRSIIEAHGGRIWAEPNEGPGLTVQFSVPTAAAREPAVFRNRSSNHASGIDDLHGKSDSAAPKKVLRRKPPSVVNSARHQSTRSAH